MSLAGAPEVVLFADTDVSESEKFEAKCLLPDLNFPVNPKWKEKVPEIVEDDADGKLDPNAINILLPTLIRHVHGSLDSKTKLIEDFLEQHPECSRNSVFRKFDLFAKEKRANDIRQRYYVTQAAIEGLDEFPNGLENEELINLEKERLQPLLDEIAEQEKREQIEKLEKERAKEAEREEREQMRQEELAQKAKEKEARREEKRLEREKEREIQKAQQELEK